MYGLGHKFASIFPPLWLSKILPYSPLFWSFVSFFKTLPVVISGRKTTTQSACACALCVCVLLLWFAFTASTLLVGCQEEHSACKKWVMRCQHGYLSRARCWWFAYCPAEVTATPSCPGALKSRMVLPFWCQLPQVILEKLLLNRCLASILHQNG